MSAAHSIADRAARNTAGNAMPPSAAADRPRGPGFRAVAWAYVACVSLLALTGTMQMPIASRYRIVAVPGLGWLGDFWLTHKLHYVGAIGLLALAGYVGTLWLLEWRRAHGLSALGWARVGLLALLVGTGAVRVLKNLPGVNFAPDPIMLVDWAHLGLAVALGLLALVRLGFKASYWAKAAPRVRAPRRDAPVS